MHPALPQRASMRLTVNRLIDGWYFPFLRHADKTISSRRTHLGQSQKLS